MGLRSKEARQSRCLIIQRRPVAVLLVLLCVLTGGCGYKVKGNSGKLDLTGKSSITIGKIRNLTSYRKAGIILGEKLKDTLIANGYRGSFGMGGEYLVHGDVQDLNERPVGFSEARLGLEYEISCFVSVELVEAGTGRSVFHLKNYQDTSTYYRGVDATYSRTNREKAIQFVMEKIAIRFVDFLKEL